MRRKGFTLLELIIVIVILGILASFAMPRYFRAAEKARAAEGISILGTFRSAQIRERAQRGNYAGACGGLDVEIGAPRFFAAPVCAAADPIVSITRDLTNANNAVEPGVAYTITITADGLLACGPAGALASCTAVMP
ncbi:MAG: prepilin-type N-terminal cleavage/methylation domain-containing protein [Candidatus Omnitrophota bacterium]